MSKPFKVGERVKMYASFSQPHGCAGLKCVVTHVHNGDYVEVKADDGVTRGAHPKQLRRLKPRAKHVKITREKLAKAWVNSICRLLTKQHFNDLARALGLEEV